MADPEQNDPPSANTVTVDPETHELVYPLDFFTKNSGLLFFYSNATAMPSTVGGLPAGTTFSNMSLTTLLNKLLYPYQYPSFTSFSFLLSGTSGATHPTVVEVGYEMPEAVRRFSWGMQNLSNVTQGTGIVRDVTGGGVDLASNLSNTPLNGGWLGTGGVDLSIGPIKKTVQASHTWRILFQNSNNDSFARDFTVNWLWGFYYGESLSSSLSNEEVLSLRVKNLATSWAGTYSLLGGGYKWFVFPTSFGQPTRFKDVSTQLDVAMELPLTIQVTNALGQTRSYYAYRTTNILGGAIQVIIS